MKHLPQPTPLAPADLFIEAPICVAGDLVEFGGRLHETGGARRRIWFRFPAAIASALTRRADPFVIAAFIHAMKRIDCLRVHAPISEGLASNLAEFQSAYASFQGMPRRDPIQIVGADIVTDRQKAPAHRGVTAFSGGVDSCFSVFRHSALSTLRPKRPVAAALIMHGFDIPIDQPEVFARAARRARRLTDDAGVELFAGATNVRILMEPWEATFATGVAAALSFFQPAFSFGLIPSFQEWTRARLDHGSNPVTDPLLSSRSFGIVHDGAGYSRIEKLRELTRWPAALENLRVCWEGAQLDRNCGRCEKCLRTMLMLKLCGVAKSPAFPSGLDPRSMDRLVIRNQSGFDDFGALITEAHRLGVRAPWVGQAERALRRNQRAWRLWRRGRSLAVLLPEPWREALRRAGRRWIWRDRRTANAAAAETPAQPGTGPDSNQFSTERTT